MRKSMWDSKEFFMWQARRGWFYLCFSGCHPAQCPACPQDHSWMSQHSPCSGYELQEIQQGELSGPRKENLGQSMETTSFPSSVNYHTRPLCQPPMAQEPYGPNTAAAPVAAFPLRQKWALLLNPGQRLPNSTFSPISGSKNGAEL